MAVTSGVFGKGLKLKKRIYEKRKPWNKGRIDVSVWRKPNKTKNYYANFNGGQCSDYKNGFRSLFFPERETSKVLPPDKLSAFLRLAVLKSVPEEYQQFK